LRVAFFGVPRFKEQICGAVILDGGSVCDVRNDSVERKRAAWTKALTRAGITKGRKFRFHDLRHTFATWIVQNGGDAAQLQRLGGWKSHEMVSRYAKLSTAQLAKTSSIIDGVMPALPKKLKLVVNK
jgi:integrase